MANRLAELRAVARVRHGRTFSQSALADRIGVGRQTLASWEQGLTEPSVVQALALAHEFGVTVEELGFGETRAHSESETREHDEGQPMTP